MERVACSHKQQATGYKQTTMLMIRLSRVGKKKQPTYRLIVSDKRKDPWGNYLENLGNYNPRTKKAELKKDRIKEWIGKGAQPSDTVHNLLIENGVIEGKKLNVSTLTKRIRKEAADKKAAEEKAAVEARKAAKAAAEAPASAEATAGTPAETPKEETPAA